MTFATFPDIGLDRKIDHRPLWNYCQQHDWVLFTEDRNDDNDDSLQSTLNDSWRDGHLPILTLANKGRFENEPTYAERVATDVAELLFGIVLGDYRDLPRIYVPK